jgi:hypothetical protein
MIFKHFLRFLILMLWVTAIIETSNALIVETNPSRLIGKHDRFVEYDGTPPTVTEGIVRGISSEYITVGSDDGHTTHVQFKYLSEDVCAKYGFNAEEYYRKKREAAAEAARIFAEQEKVRIENERQLALKLQQEAQVAAEKRRKEEQIRAQTEAAAAAEATKQQEIAKAQQAYEEKMINEKRLQSLNALSGDLEKDINKLKPGFWNWVFHENRVEIYDRIAKNIKDLMTSNGEDVVSRLMNQPEISEVDRGSIFNAYSRLQSHEVVQSQLQSQSAQLGRMQRILNLTHAAANDAALNSSEAARNSREAAHNSREAAYESRVGRNAAEEAVAESRAGRRAAEDAASAARSIYIPPSR